MSRADIGLFGEELYEQVLPMHGPDPDGLARDLIGAWTHGVREVDELVRDSEKGPGWGVILDVDDAPVKGLAWLAQLAGVQLRAPKLLTGIANYAWYGSFEAPSLLPLTGSADITIARVVGATTQRAAFGRVTVTSSGANRKVTGAFSVFLAGSRTWTASLDVLAISIATPPAKLRLSWLESGVEVATSDANVTTTGRVAVTGTAPVNADAVWAQIVVPVATAGDVIDVDAIQLNPGTNSIYLDGEMVGIEWAGTPDVSLPHFNRLETADEWGAYARRALREQNAKRRGTRRAMLDAVRDTLTGARYANLLERVGGNAYALTLITRPSETPDAAATYAAALTQKPLGMALTHTLVESVTVDEGSKTIDTATATIDTATLGDVAS
jgi:hypothetical protein